MQREDGISGVESGMAAFEALTTAYSHKRTERPALYWHGLTTLM
jgi:hypothetical protein